MLPEKILIDSALRRIGQEADYSTGTKENPPWQPDKFQYRLPFQPRPVVPNMGMTGRLHSDTNFSAMHLTATGNALFSKTQQRVLGMLFGDPERRFYTNEIVRLANMGRGTITRELERLVTVGLITSVREGNQRYYQVNPASPIFPEMRGIVRKTSGVDNIISHALQQWHERIRLAFVYGAIANGKENAGTSVDLFIVAEDLTYGDVMLALNEAVGETGRAVNPSIYTRFQIQRELNKGNAFINRVLRQPKLWVFGNDGDLKKFRKSMG